MQAKENKLGIEEKKKQFEQLGIYRKIAGECIENNNLFGQNLIYRRKKNTPKINHENFGANVNGAYKCIYILYSS